MAAKLIRFDSAYLRFTGELRIEHRHVGTVVDSYTTRPPGELLPTRSRRLPSGIRCLASGRLRFCAVAWG
jgi:hypothetical protein